MSIIIGTGIYERTLSVGSPCEIQGTIAQVIPTAIGKDFVIQPVGGSPQFTCHGYDVSEYFADAHWVVVKGKCSAINGDLVTVTLSDSSVTLPSFGLNGGDNRPFLW